MSNCVCEIVSEYKCYDCEARETVKKLCPLGRTRLTRYKYFLEKEFEDLTPEEKSELFQITYFLSSENLDAGMIKYL